MHPSARGDAASARLRRVGRVVGDDARRAIAEAVSARFAAPVLLPCSGEVELDAPIGESGPIITTVVEHSFPSPVVGSETMSLLAEEGIAVSAAAASVWAEHPSALMVVVGLCLARSTHRAPALRAPIPLRHPHQERPGVPAPSPAPAEIPRDEISPRGAFFAARACLTPPRRFHDDCCSRSFSHSSLRTRSKRFRAA